MLSELLRRTVSQLEVNMNYKTILSGQTFVFDSVKEVLAKAGEQVGRCPLAGVAAQSDMKADSRKEVLCGYAR